MDEELMDEDVIDNDGGDDADLTESELAARLAAMVTAIERAGQNGIDWMI